MRIEGEGVSIEIDDELIDRIQRLKGVLESLGSVVSMHAEYLSDLATAIDNATTTEENE